MAILALPTEVLTHIIRTLDTESVCKLYETCKYFRDLIRTPAIVNRCQFSLNTLATVKSFNLTFFRDISGHLKALNLSGVHDLNKSSLISVLKILKSLKHLDVTFTNITMPDYLEFVKLMPALKSLAINFSFAENDKIDKDMIMDYQKAFAGLKHVHFVGCPSHLGDGKLAVSILNRANLLNLKFTICYLHGVEFRKLEFDAWDENDSLMLKTSQFEAYFIEEIFDSPLVDSGIFKLIDLKKYEIVLFQNCFKAVFATELLQEYIYETFKVNVDSLNYSHGMVGQAVLLLWNKEQTTFDGAFYSKLMLFLQEYLVYKFEFIKHTETPAPIVNKWYHVEQFAPGFNEYDSYEEVIAKRARLAGKTFAIDYDCAFRNKKDNFKLKITFLPISRPVSLKVCSYLSKLSHLILNRDCQLSVSFYNNLFSCCTSLVTLEIVRQRGIVATALKHLSKSRNLKNLLLHVRGAQLAPIYTYLSQCKTLENIKLVNTTLKRFEEVEFLPDPTELFTRCDRLYSICLEAFFLEEWDRDKQLRDYAVVRERLGKDALNIDIVRFADARFGRRYNPYNSVFNVAQLKPI